MTVLLSVLVVLLAPLSMISAVHAAPALTPQTITFGPAPSGATVGDSGVSVSATADSGLPVTYSTSTPAVCSVDPDSGALVLLDAGTCTVLADQAGDATYDAAPQATIDVTVDPAAPPPTPRGCRSYTGQSFVGSVVLNPDGTPIGCGLTSGTGSPADLVPATWPGEFENEFGSGDPSYTTRLGWACDDCWIGPEGEDSSTGFPIGFPINFYGTTYSDVFVNSNGSISFGAGSDTYDEPLEQILDGSAGVIAYGMDLDNREIARDGSAWGSGRHGDFFYWGRTTFQGQQAFVATWMNEQSYYASTSKTDWNTFQIMLVDIDGNAGSNVDIIVNYGSMQANDEGYSEGCADGEDTCVAIGLGSVQDGSVQYASIVDDSGVLYNGRTSADVADDGAHPLSVGHLNSSIAGRFKFQMRNGTVPQTATPPGAPTITSAVRGDAQGTVSWSDPANLGGSPISGYTVRWRTAGSSDAWTTSDVSTSPETITGLTNGVTYEVQVAATNGTGTGAFSSPATFSPGIAGSPDWTDTILAPMVAGVPFADAVAASGTPAPTYSVVAGALPDGLSLDPVTGAITGTPSAVGPFDFTIRASNGVGADATFRFTGEVEAVAATPAPAASVAVTVAVTIPPTSTLSSRPATADASGPVAGMLIVLSALTVLF
ncbi:MAG: fibronectin type III domain-containing protein, partial [Chloroflexota bacterium]|nr:fibronectin type III domain-containing protein [Chloroflexota bacterium]